MRMVLIVGACLGSAGCTNSAEDISEEIDGNANVETVSFISFGDWGTGTSDQMAVAAAMTTFCQSHDCDFAATVGDNFYEDGVTSVQDPYFQDRFEIPYAGMDFLFYHLLGNHDIAGNVQAQIDYTHLSDKWRLLSGYYTHAHPEIDPVVEFFVINTNIGAFDAEQAAWLAAAVDASTADWKIVTGHHPFYSNGLHGDDESNIGALFVPAVCDKIDMILSGHDHIKEYLVSSSEGCELRQVVNGTGGVGLYSVTPDARTQFSAVTFGFAHFVVTPETLTFTFYDTSGQAEYTAELTKNE